MFNIESAIAEWRQQMLAAGIESPAPLNELESHLREEIGRQMQSGLDEQQAFEAATALMGQPGTLKLEFENAQAETWPRPLAWTAWILFVISFFLPAYAEGYGWQCAGLSATAVSWAETKSGDWLDIHFALLTLANLLMLTSPFLLWQFSQKTHFLKWLRIANFSALALVWSFLARPIISGEAKDLKIGCYVWAVSFLVLFLSTFQRRVERERHA